jgi:hypothetical protein
MDRSNVAAFLGLIFCLVAGECSRAAGQDAPKTEIERAFRTPHDELLAARALVAECGWNVAPPDAAAVLWVLVRRYSRPEVGRRYPTFANFVRTYSTPLRTLPHARARAIAKLEVGDTPSGALRGSAWSWGRVQEFVRAFKAGRVSDPCHGRADHFGSATDGAPRHFEIVDCGRTTNRFYRVVR